MVPNNYNIYTAYSAQSSVTPRGFRAPEPQAEPTAPVWPPEHFPQKLKDLCLEYEDVLVENLTPFYARRPRRFPLHWSEKIKKETAKLIKAGIIEKMP